MARRTRRVRRYLGRIRRRGGKSKAIPLVPLATGLAPTFIAIQKVGGIQGIMNDPTETIRQVIFENTGFDINYSGAPNFGILGRNIGLWIGGYAVHAIANRTVNKSIHKIPFVGKYISL